METTLDPAVCYLKPEYKINFVKNEDQESSAPPPAKKQKKDSGMNKNRPITFKENFADKLCRVLVHGGEVKCEKENCRFLHDVQSYLENKLPDLGEKCPIYSTKGFCMFGLTCRFAGAHLTEDKLNMNVPADGQHKTNERGNLSHELQNLLRKKKYDFAKADAVLKDIQEYVIKKRADKKLGTCEDEEAVAIRPEERKKIDFQNKLILAPLTTVGNLPFRRICKEYGADITIGEMACSFPLINAQFSEWALTKRHSSEDVFGVQIEGNNPKFISYAAQLLKEYADVDFVDLNLGCPIDLIFKRGGGSALLRRENVLEQIIRSCSKLLGDMPFTVKSRMGVYNDKPVAKELLPKFEKWGASAVTLHGRSREQRYSKTADWKYIEDCGAQLKIPLIGNGDVYSFEDYLNVKESYPHVSSVMLGRGALIKPWLFKEIKEQKVFDISGKERLELIQKFVNYGLEHWGSDTQGVETTRRFLLEWLSFLYRYVPHGIQLYPPQKINQRPECSTFLGRDDLETLLASKNGSDWIKITEMFLGKVPDKNFEFVPKHKASAY